MSKSTAAKSSKTTAESAAKPAKAPKKAATPRARKKTDVAAADPEVDGPKAPRRRAASGEAGGMIEGLVIVESPAKAKTIEKYLSPDFPGYRVVASIGHVVDLPVSTLGVDIDNDFSPQYEIIKGKKNIIDGMKRLARSARKIFIAPDPDREGEAIAYHIAQLIGDEKKEIHRATFNEVTRDAIRLAIQNPRDVNLNLFNAQQARRILDRLVGYKISPLLWKKVRRGLSAGRVQSVALRILCDREREVRSFKPVEYWTIEAVAAVATPPPFHIRLAKVDGKDPEIPDQASSDALLSELKGKPFVVGAVEKKDVARRPFPPFITSTLQQEASRKLRFAARHTMRLAQRLYEGVELGSEGPQGLITYMRTDSTRLADTAIHSIRTFIGATFGANFVPPSPRTYAKGKAAQDAHEAIRPTDISRTPELVAPFLEREALALYTLIWNRTMASQMADAMTERTRVEIPVGRCLFVATGSVIRFPGFLKIYEEARDEAGKTESDAEGIEPVKSEADESLPPINKGDSLKVDDLAGSQHFTQPPPRFTEAGLIKELEKQGIGRPSTYATIISTIVDREYAEKDKGSFKPSDLGFIVTDLLTESFPQIMDVKFTALMENQLDEVEEGKVNWVELLRNFYQPFSKRLEAATEQMRNLKAEVIPTEHVCEKCGSPMVVRWGRNGKFLACSAYPNCKSTKPIVMTEDGQVKILHDEKTDRKCPNCGSAMVIKSGRRGRFLACSAYPECKTSAPLPVNIPCGRVGCTGELVERRSGRGKVFYSCNTYPACRYLVGELPVKATCSTCGKEKFMIGKSPREKVLGCAEPNCPYPPAYNAKEAGPEGTEAGEAPVKPRRGGPRKKALAEAV